MDATLAQILTYVVNLEVRLAEANETIRRLESEVGPDSMTVGDDVMVSEPT